MDFKLAGLIPIVMALTSSPACFCFGSRKNARSSAVQPKTNVAAVARRRRASVVALGSSSPRVKRDMFIRFAARHSSLRRRASPQSGSVSAPPPFSAPAAEEEVLTANRPTAPAGVAPKDAAQPCREINATTKRYDAS